MVCSACGHESPAGNRFCGMCGTPLPYRPLNTPEAEGTMSLTRGPLENSRLEERESTTAAETPRFDSTVSQMGKVFEQAKAPKEEPLRSADLPPTEQLVWADPLRDFVEHLDHLSLNPEEMATSGETPAMQPEACVLVDAPAITPAGPSTPAEAPHFPWMEDVLEQLAELDAAQASERPNERPPFLDLLDELTPPAVEPDAYTSAVVASSFSEVSEGPQTIAGSDVTTGGEAPPGKKWLIWLATAAVLVFAVVGTMQWRSQRNHTVNGPLEVIKGKIRDLKPNNRVDTNKHQSEMSAGSAGTNTSSPAIRPEEQSKSQDESTATNASAPATGSNGTPAIAKLKPVPRTTRDEDREVAVRKVNPGDREMTKAKHAKDTAAEVTWLWKATAKGNPDAPVRLADMYHQRRWRAAQLRTGSGAAENGRDQGQRPGMQSVGFDVFQGSLRDAQSCRGLSLA